MVTNRKDYARQHYLDNKEIYKSRAKANMPLYRDRNRRFVNKYKMIYGCSRCGYKQHAAALDLHHINDSKDECISILVKNACSLERLKQEIRNCIILCANCHRIHHAK